MSGRPVRVTVLAVFLCTACHGRPSDPSGDPAACAPNPNQPSGSQDPRTARAPAVMYILAETVADIYERDPEAAEKDHGGSVADFVGLVDAVERDERGRTAVLLRAGRTNEHAAAPAVQEPRRIRCILSDTSASAAALPEKGQLVVIRGSTQGREGKLPVIAEAEIRWAGERPSVKVPKAEVERNAVTTGRAAEECLARSPEFMAKAKSEGGETAQRVAQAMREMNAGNVAGLAGMLPCLQPLELMTVICDDQLSYNAEIKAGRTGENALLAKHLDPSLRGKSVPVSEACTDEVRRAVARMEKLESGGGQEKSPEAAPVQARAGGHHPG